MPTPRRSTASFVLEEHLGHETYRDNLRAAADDQPGIEATWHAVTYQGALPGAWTGRREVRRALGVPADVRVFNTQVPAALGGRLVHTRPYVVITDITPVQYDAMAEAYGHRVDRIGAVRRWKHRVNRRVFRQARFAVGWSTWTAESIVADYGAEPDRVRVIPPGVDLDRWQPGTDPGHDAGPSFRVLFVGGDFERKGGADLLDAFASLPGDVELVLVTRTDVPTSDRVTVVRDLGPNDPRLIELYRTSDAFALPTRAEAFGIAAVEASAAGLPVVATDVGGLRDVVIDGETGVVVPPGDPAALARALAALAADAGLRRRMAAAARRRAEEHFDAAANAARLFDLVRRAASERAPEEGPD